jgi:hypothetical protein
MVRMCCYYCCFDYLRKICVCLVDYHHHCHLLAALLNRSLKVLSQLWALQSKRFVWQSGSGSSCLWVLRKKLFEIVESGSAAIAASTVVELNNSATLVEPELAGLPLARSCFVGQLVLVAEPIVLAAVKPVLEWKWCWCPDRCLIHFKSINLVVRLLTVFKFEFGSTLLVRVVVAQLYSYLFIYSYHDSKFHN